MGSKERKYFLRRFNKLRYDKRGYRLLDVSKNIELWELRCSSHRVFYTVENKYIVIENVEYEGDINISTATNKNKQKRVIKKLKQRIS